MSAAPIFRAARVLELVDRRKPDGTVIHQSARLSIDGVGEVCLTLSPEEANAFLHGGSRVVVEFRKDGVR
jgi:hypothetical protein